MRRASTASRPTTLRWARAGHDPDVAEKALSEVEGAAADIISGVDDGVLPRTDTERLHLALFVALQATRGWAFRNEVNQAGTLRMRQELEGRRDEMATRVQGSLRRRGRPSGPDAIKEYVDDMLGPHGPHLVLNDAARVQESIRHAMHRLAPMLLSRCLRIIRFKEPSLVVSDAPVGAWVPGGKRAVGIGNAELVLMPVSRYVALAYGRTASKPVSVGGPERARQINFLAADEASRWIYEHPNDHIIESLDVPTERPQWTTEFVVTRNEPDGSRRELWQHVRP